MTLFLSTYKNKIDKKLRVSIPSQFRAAIACSQFQGVVLHKSISSNCVEGMTIEKLTELTDAIDKLDPFSQERDAFETIVLGGSVQLGFDPEGRIIIPQDIALEYGLNEIAVFVGKGRKFQIWNEDEFTKHQKESREIAMQNRDKIKSTSH